MRNELDFFPCTYATACNILWAVLVEGWSQTKAAIVFEVNSSTVSRIVNGRRFKAAVPIPPMDHMLR